MKPPSSSAGFDPQSEAENESIQIADRAGGGKEFILPAARNFKEKAATTFILASFAGIFVFMFFFARSFMAALPWTWVRLLAVNIFFYPLVIPGLVAALFVIVCADTWLRSTRVVAVSGELQVLTRWLFVRRAEIIPADKIIRTRAANNASVNDTQYFDIEVVTTGEKPSRFYYFFPPTKVQDEIELQRIRTGGKNFRAMTNIVGQDEAEWILSQLRGALNINV
jgi:hypothetical protein